MNLWIKVAIGTVLGFAGGFASGYFLHKKLNDVEFEEVTQEELDILEKAATNQGQTTSEKVVSSVQDLPEDPDKLRMNLQGKVSYVQADQEAKEKYAKIWNTVKRYSDEENANEMPIQENEDEQTDPEDGFDEEFLESLEEEQIDPGHVVPPHPISLAEFYNERNEYDKITIDWYEPDTFLDEKEETIADLRTYIGDIDIRKLFANTQYDEDPDIRFVRNERYGTDYEIIRHHRTWSETTGGSE